MVSFGFQFKDSLENTETPSRIACSSAPDWSGFQFKDSLENTETTINTAHTL